LFVFLLKQIREENARLKEELKDAETLTKQISEEHAKLLSGFETAIYSVQTQLQQFEEGTSKENSSSIEFLSIQD
jgi:hypothetical protein